MKILFVSMTPFENNASATIQNKGIIKGLANLGNEIDTLTLVPNTDVISYDDSMNDISDLIDNSYYIDMNPIYRMLMAKKQKPVGLKMQESNGNKVNRNGAKRFLKKTRHIAKNIYGNISIFDAQKYNVKEVARLNIDYAKYDIIISASDPKSSHLIVERIFKDNKNCKAKWIQYWGDPMLIDITRQSDWRDQLVKHKEAKLIAKADRVVYASPLTLRKQREIFLKHSSKMEYASQAYINVPNDISDRDSKDEEPITVGYFGAYVSTVRNIIPLYNTIKESNFRLDICGSSDIILEETKNISIHGAVSYDKVLDMEQKADILVCICNNRGTQIPGKIYYCSAYRKPIIVILDSEYKDELRDYFKGFNRFILCDNNEASIKNALERAKSELSKENYNISERLTPEYMARKIIGGSLD